MRDEEELEQRRPPTVGRAIRDSFQRYLDEIVLFLIVNVGLALLIALFAFVRIGIPLAIVLAPLLALPTAALMRLAVVAARDRAPSLAMARGELGRLAGRKVALAAIQLLVIAVGTANVFVGGGIGGILGAVSAIISGYVVLATWVYATALWPIVCDPEHEGPVREQLRLALAVMVLRPLQTGLLAILAALAVIVSVQLVVPSIFLPSLILLAVAGYVVPAVDGVRRAPAA